MSLINKMLQDLDARNAAPGRERPPLGAAPALAAPSPLARYARSAVLLLLGAAVAATAWLVLRPNASANANAARTASTKPIEAPLPILPTASSASSASADGAARVAAAARSSAPGANPVPAPVKQAAQALIAMPSNVPASAPRADRQTEVHAESRAERASASTAAPAPQPAPQPITAPAKIYKQTTPQQDSENAYRTALSQYQQGQVEEARRNLNRALDRNPSNGRARQMLAGLSIDSGQLDEAARLLRQGLQIQPEESGFAMSLARLQLESGDTPGAIATMEKGLQAAGDDAAYHALYAVLLQRQQRHDEAVKHYLVALRSDPAKPTWLVGVGASLQALGNKADAIAAYSRARDGGMLPPSLLDYVDAQLALLNR